MGVLAGGTMLLNSWTNYGGLDVKECVESYKKNVLNDPVLVQQCKIGRKRTLSFDWNKMWKV